MEQQQLLQPQQPVAPCYVFHDQWVQPQPDAALKDRHDRPVVVEPETGVPELQGFVGVVPADPRAALVAVARHRHRARPDSIVRHLDRFRSGNQMLTRRVSEELAHRAVHDALCAEADVSVDRPLVDADYRAIADAVWDLAGRALVMTVDQTLVALAASRVRSSDAYALVWASALLMLPQQVFTVADHFVLARYVGMVDPPALAAMRHTVRRGNSITALQAEEAEMRTLGTLAHNGNVDIRHVLVATRTLVPGANLCPTCNRCGYYRCSVCG